MESIAFESFGIDTCLNKNCNQLYNKDSIKVAVWLYGIVFLHEEKQFEIADKLFFEATEHEKLTMDKETEGFIGITCPKCLKTNLYKKSIKEIQEFKTFLYSWSLPDKKDKDTAQPSNWMTDSVSMKLRYYFPFDQSGTLLKASCIHEYSYDEQIADFDFSQEVGMAIVTDEHKDLQNSFCTYSLQDKVEPLGENISIYWFIEKDILRIIKHENEKGERILPRYYYFHETIEKIDRLLKYNYIAGQPIERLLAATEELMKTDLGKYEYYFRKKERIEEQKKQNKTDFESPKNFLDILTSNPVELKPFMGEPLKNCDYLWIKRNPFSGKGMPIDFSFGNQHDEYAEIAAELKSIHEKMVDLVRENYHKQYVQEFLKDNLIDFLEEYEEFIRSNTFSYATVWELKESYMEGLYKATLKGLSEDALYVMKREMNAWKIVFNNIKTEKLLIGMGFAYIYFLLCNENEYYYHADLIKEGGNISIAPKNDNAEYNDDNDSPEPEQMISKEDLRELIQDIKAKKNKLSDAKEFKDHDKIIELEDELKNLRKYKSEVYNPKTNRPRYFKNENNKKAIDSVGNAIKRALTSLAKKHPEAHQHIFKALDGKHLYRETLSYRPAPEEKIDWIFV